MRLALLHRRLATLMAASALLAFGAGFGLGSPEVMLTAAVLGAALVWRLPPEWGVWLDRISRLVALLLFGSILYIAFVIEGDFLRSVLALLLFLLAAETLRPLDISPTGSAAAGEDLPSDGTAALDPDTATAVGARHDLRLYALSFSLLIAATAFYPGPVFAAMFVAYVGLATLALMVGHLRRQADRFGIADIRIGKPFLVATAALSAVTVLMSVALFVIFPRLPRSWIGSLRRPAVQAMAGFGSTVSLTDYGVRIYPNPEVVFRVEFPSDPPANPSALHWRGRSFDRFDGFRWSDSRRTPPAPTSDFYAERWQTGSRTYEVFGGPGGVRLLFGLHPIVGVRAQSAIRPIRTADGDIAFWGTAEPVYRVTSLASLPPEAALRGVPDGSGNPSMTPYLQFPQLPPRILQLADSLTTGLPTRYDRARAVEAFFKREFDYTLELPSTARQATLDHFLFERRAGHCEYFSTAMAVLLRAAGIPARNVNGFLGGEWNASRNYLAVTQNDAHSWVEVWFPELGWVPFDPTPSASREEVAGMGAGRSWSWPVRFWLDGVEHQWFKWVLYYDLDKQLQVFRSVSEMFSPGAVRMPRPGGPVTIRPLLPWIGAIAGALVLFWFLRGRRRPDHSPETQAYLALRSAYERAGHAPSGAETPLAFRDALRRTDAPGTPEAERVVELYVRARFAGEDIGEQGHAELHEALTAARRAVREETRRPLAAAQRR